MWILQANGVVGLEDSGAPERLGLSDADAARVRLMQPGQDMTIDGVTWFRLPENTMVDPSSDMKGAFNLVIALCMLRQQVRFAPSDAWGPYHKSLIMPSGSEDRADKQEFLFKLIQDFEHMEIERVSNGRALSRDGEGERDEEHVPLPGGA